jgi:hypothetical protein
MVRELTSHLAVGGDLPRIEVLDEAGPGNACHEYDITNMRPGCDQSDAVHCRVRFQKGAVQEAGVNGVSNEALLAIVADRLEGFQSGPFACSENADALEAVFDALEAVSDALVSLKKRTLRRIARGVEGRSVI